MKLPVGPLPLSTETACPRCKETVVVSLKSVAAEVEVRTVELVPTYSAYHRCPDLPHAEPDPWEHVPAPKAGS